MQVAGKALWSGRFAEGMDDSTLAFTSSLDVDSVMAFYDVMGSLAHVRMLKRCRIIDAEDADEIARGLIAIAGKIQDGTFELDESLEDVVRECLDYGQLRGLAQWRNSGKGRFAWEEITEE